MTQFFIVFFKSLLPRFQDYEILYPNFGKWLYLFSFKNRLHQLFARFFPPSILHTYTGTLFKTNNLHRQGKNCRILH